MNTVNTEEAKREKQQEEGGRRGGGDVNTQCRKHKQQNDRCLGSVRWRYT